MKWLRYLAYLPLALSIVSSKATAFRLGDKHVALADVGGKPVHLAIAQALQVLLMAALSGYGSLQVGTVTVTITPWTGTV